MYLIILLRIGQKKEKPRENICQVIQKVQVKREEENIRLKKTTTNKN
jgi:hypothetical protein